MKTFKEQITTYNYEGAVELISKMEKHIEKLERLFQLRVSIYLTDEYYELEKELFGENI